MRMYCARKQLRWIRYHAIKQSAINKTPSSKQILLPALFPRLPGPAKAMINASMLATEAFRSTMPLSIAPGINRQHANPSKHLSRLSLWPLNTKSLFDIMKRSPRHTMYRQSRVRGHKVTKLRIRIDRFLNKRVRRWQCIRQHIKNSIRKHARSRNLQRSHLIILSAPEEMTLITMSLCMGQDPNNNLPQQRTKPLRRVEIIL